MIPLKYHSLPPSYVCTLLYLLSCLSFDLIWKVKFYSLDELKNYLFKK